MGCCEVEEGVNDTVSGTPIYDGTSETTYSCVSGVHSQYEVHVISNYEVMDYTNLVTLISLVQLTDVNVNVDGSGSIPLVLVFVSYEPLN